MFQIKSFTSIVASMVNRMRATTTRFNDFNVGSKARTLVEAVAQEQDELYRQILNATLEALPVSVFNSFSFTPLPASAALGSYRVTIAAQTTDTQILQGAIFTCADQSKTYVAISAVTIAAGTMAADVPVVCGVVGAVGNLAAGDQATLSPTPAGFLSATNLAPISGGIDAESNAARGIRFRAYISTLTRGIGPALVYGAKLAKVTDAAGNVLERVTSAVVIEPYLTDNTQNPAYVRVYVFNGVGGTSAALVAQAAQMIAGYVDPTTGAKVAGYKAAGIPVDVFAAPEQSVNVTAALTAAPGQTHSLLVASATSAIASYIAALDIGDGHIRRRQLRVGLADCGCGAAREHQADRRRGGDLLMLLTTKLLRRLNRVWRKTGNPGTALRLRAVDGSRLLWQVADKQLTVTPAVGNPVAFDLSTGTVQTLIAQLEVQFSVPFFGSDFLSLSPLVLIDGSGDTYASNGDAIAAYSDWHYAYLDACADELDQLRAQIPQIGLELQTTTADGEWLNKLGMLYGVPRLLGELDLRYGPRIIAEVLQPRCNNVAMEILIQQATGQVVTVTDAPLAGTGFPTHGGVIHYDGTHTHTASSTTIHGLFDVNVGYDLLSATDPSGFAVQVTALVERIRAAGTHLRALSLRGSVLTDSIPAPADGADSLLVSKTYRHDGQHTYASRFQHQPSIVQTTLDGGVSFSG